MTALAYDSKHENETLFQNDNKLTKRNIFKPRKSFKPFEYPEVLQFKDAIRHSYWLHTEWNFVSDVQDFNVKLSEKEKSVVKNSLLAISQIEVSVKKFWSKLGDKFPKSEFDAVGVTYADSEARHADAYSHLLERLDLNADFEQLLKIPAILARVDYLNNSIKGYSTASDKEFSMNLALFSMFVENVSLFSQFAIIKSFNKYKNYLKDIDNVVQATLKEELVHALLGIWIINQIKSENPTWFNEQFYKDIAASCQYAYDAEAKIVDWIFEQGDLDFIGKDVIKELIKDRFNESLVQVGGNKLFDVDEDLLSELQWFRDEIYAETNVDFFYKKSTNYSKKMQSFTADDLF